MDHCVLQKDPHFFFFLCEIVLIFLIIALKCGSLLDCSLPISFEHVTIHVVLRMSHPFFKIQL